MDITPLITPQPLFAANKLTDSLNLKVGQQLDVKVIGADIQAAKNAITLAVGDKDVTVQSNQPIKLNPGQDLKVQVTKVAPTLEFKILDSLPELKTQAAELRLRLISTARDGGSVADGREPMRPTAKDGGSVADGQELMRPTVKDGVSMESMSPAAGNSKSAATALPTVNDKPGGSAPLPSANPALAAKIIGIAGDKIQLQLLDAGNKPAGTISLDRTQLTNAPQDLKPGQSLNLEIVKTGTRPEFKIISPGINIPEAKVAEFVRQFLPKHEASPILLNQLINDLPKLMKNESVPQSLKDIAAKIVQNLPAKEQLITSQGLKQSLVNSGLFLEAKIAQTELPQLIKNETVPQSLQRFAAEILQNLTQKSPGLDQPASDAKPIPATGLANPEDGIKTNATAKTEEQRTDPLQKTAMPGESVDDFKANLLKFVQALKQEITHQAEQPSNPLDLDLLKNLHTKTENTVAKLVLDQLMSLPRDDSPKQQWIIDIPFIDRQQAESVRIEVRQDRGAKQQSGNGDWSVNITITPPGLGTIHCVVSFQNDVINTFFKSRNTQTTDLIKHNLDYLKSQLEDSGLKTGHMDAHAEAKNIQPVHPHQLSGKKLFDDKA